jgi:hypothetical protein
VPGLGDRLAPLVRLADRCARNQVGPHGNWLTRAVLLRVLGLVYTMAFLTLALQGPALLGPKGLEPIGLFLDRVAAEAGSRASGFWTLPSVFWWFSGAGAIAAAGWAGVALGLLVLGGYANGVVLGLLCALQISIADVGQTFYGFGWELQLVETGFLCAFLVPLLDGRPFPRRPPPAPVVWLLRWLAVRIMWGAGLIKLRGDPCWRDLTCLDHHFETQPIPNPLSPYFHALPHAAHAAGVLFNHFVELVAPFFVFGPRRLRIFAGVAMLALQVILILSGNLSFLNWLTILPILACFDDGVWRRVLPRALVRRAEADAARAQPSRAQGFATAGLGAAIALLSVPAVLNLLSGRQVMNGSFTRLPLVNTYGAFGSVERERRQLVFEGTEDQVLTKDTVWRPYLFKCQPVDPARRPCWMSPYHDRLDWLLWFAAMGTPRDDDWSLRLVWNLLGADPATLGLLGADPFHGRRPRYIRVELYRYELAPPGAPTWWRRQRLGTWLPPLSRDDPRLRDYLRAGGWAGAGGP